MVRKIKKVLLYFYYGTKECLIKIDRIKRKILSNKYDQLSKHKDEYKGQACFIIGTGPSMQVNDLVKIMGIPSFSANGIVYAYDKTDWRPTYYGIQDDSIFQKVRNLIDTKDYKDIFVSNKLAKSNKDIGKDVSVFPYDEEYHMYDTFFKSKIYAKFSEDITDIVYDGYTILYSLIQVAIYMGFRNIYLYGCDCNYKLGVGTSYFDGSKQSNIIKDADVGIRMVKAYDDLKRALNGKVNIFNCTRGGMLEVFERMTIDEAVERISIKKI